MPPFEPGIQTTLLQFLPQNITYLVLLKSLEKQLAQAPPLSLQSKPSPTLDSSGKDGDCLQCDLYLAPSTIPGAGLGIFSGVPKEIGDTVGNGDIW